MLLRTGRLLPLIAVMLLGGCASAVDGMTQVIEIDTYPTGGRCELVRDGQVIGIVDPAPYGYRVDKARGDIVIACIKPGHRVGKVRLTSRFTGVTAGNVLIGGVEGVLFDLFSGANNNYPESAEIILVPVGFDSAEDRDAHFEMLRQRVSDRTEAAKAAYRKKCPDGVFQRARCGPPPAEIDAARDAELERLEKEQADVPVGPAESARG